MINYFKNVLLIKRLGLIIVFFASSSISEAQNNFSSVININNRKMHEETANEREIQITKSKSFHGEWSIRFELLKSDPIIHNGKRSEISTEAESTPFANRWYSFNILFPQHYIPDPIAEIVAQWHAQPDFNMGETWRSPPIALSTKDGHWWLTILWAGSSVNTNKTLTGKKEIDLGPYTRDQWTDWIFHIKFSYKKNGRIEVWKNKKEIYTHSGPNYYNDEKGPYFKFGIYKWGWNKKNLKTVTDKRVLYFNNIIIGNTKRQLRNAQ